MGKDFDLPVLQSKEKIEKEVMPYLAYSEVRSYSWPLSNLLIHM